jgi:hypothetical protein
MDTKEGRTPSPILSALRATCAYLFAPPFLESLYNRRLQDLDKGNGHSSSPRQTIIEGSPWTWSPQHR